MKLHTRYGDFGGTFVPEPLMRPLEELEEAFLSYRSDDAFNKELGGLLASFAGRPTPLYFARNLSESFGSRIYLKREDLLHTGAHKLNSTLGQALLARRMGKTRLIAETGAGQHGVATAAAGAMLGLKVDVYMGSVDIERQNQNVLRMQLMGANVIAVDSGSKTLKDAVNEALRDWVATSADSYYLLGSCVGPHPYPTIVKQFQKVIGVEARRQVLEAEGKLPDYAIACVGGGSNAIGLFAGFENDQSVRLVGVEAGGNGIASGKHGASICGGRPGVLHGAYSYLVQDEDGQICETHSVSAGLDYPGVGPEHAHLHATGRAEYVSVTDAEALEAFELLSRREGIIPALESSHAIAHAKKLCRQNAGRDALIVINVSGRGDKDLGIYQNEVKRH